MEHEGPPQTICIGKTASPVMPAPSPEGVDQLASPYRGQLSKPPLKCLCNDANMQEKKLSYPCVGSQLFDQPPEVRSQNRSSTARLSGSDSSRPTRRRHGWPEEKGYKWCWHLLFIPIDQCDFLETSPRY